MKQIPWDVFITEYLDNDYGTWIGNRCLTTVYFNPDCDAYYVYDNLVNHDGYSKDIIVRNDNIYKEMSECQFYDIEEYAYYMEEDSDYLKSMYMYPLENDL